MLKKIKLEFLAIIIFTIFNMNFVLGAPIITNNVPKIDKDKKANLTITFVDSDNNILSNAEFKIYKIADISDVGVFSTVEKFKEYNWTYDFQYEEEWSDLENQVGKTIIENNIEPDQKIYTDLNGIAKLDNLELGLYYVVSNELVIGAKTYYPQNFFVSLPNMYEQDIWNYDVTE